jgi:pimeloyl-ACP methyl ester carboxylesterase
MPADAIGMVVSKDGTRIGFERSGQGEPLVLVHGSSSDRTRWRRVLPLLEPHFTVYLVDRRGRGGSGDAPGYALEREAEDLCAVVESIGGPVTLLGHSYGGVCALEAAREIRALSRLILYEPPIPLGVEIYEPGVVERLQALHDAGDREGLVVAFSTGVVRVPPAQLELMRSLPSWEGRLAAAHTLVREVRADRDYRFEPERWSALATPTLILLGGDSPPFFGAAAHALKAALPHAELRILAGQQHAAMDTSPERFAEAIREFIAGV